MGAVSELWHAVVEALRGSRGIAAGVWWNVVLLAGSLAALPFDQRRILGLNPWIKPIKFEISVIVFLVTMGMLLRVLGETGLWANLTAWLGWGFGIAMIIENSIIAMQSARGVRSHMNFTTLFDGLAFGTMGLFIALNTAMLAVLLVLFCSGKVGRPAAEIWGIRLGLAMILAGSIEGVRIVMNMGHTVGAKDGGPGLPFVNWSTLHGDLRVAHFFALHALQMFWLLGWGLGQTRLSSAVGTAAVWGTAAVYGAGVWLLFAAAMAGRPVAAMF